MGVDLSKIQIINKKGQALVEYILVMLLVLGLAGLIGRGLPRVLSKIEDEISQKYKNSYQLGDSDASVDEGTPKRHVRAGVRGNDNFRLFRRVSRR